MILLCIIAFFIFIIFHFRLYLFLHPKDRLIVLMYHHINEKTNDGLSVDIGDLDRQFEYLRRKKYVSLFFSEIGRPVAKKIIITFDDGYKNNFDHLPDLLIKHGLKAVIFIPTHFIQHGYGSNVMMTFDEIRRLPTDVIEIGLHSHSHQNFRTLSLTQAEDDLRSNMKILDDEKIRYQKVFAYPYGKHVKAKGQKKIFFNMLKKLEIDFAVRIGNRANGMRNTNPFEICRIDIKGEDSLMRFKLKLMLGKLKFF